MRHFNKYLDEIDDRATQIIKLIGDLCAMLVYSRHHRPAALRRAALKNRTCDHAAFTSA